MDDAIATLAMTGSTTIVTAMATAAWQSTRDGTARLFRRMGRAQQEAIEDQLNANAARVAQAEGPATDVRQCLVPLWRRELAELLQQHPDAAGELRALISHAQDELPSAQYDYVQNITAHIGGRAFGVQDGDLNVHFGTDGESTHTPPSTGNAGDSNGAGQ
ncbi:hypothetical protein AB0I69_22395 [Streptomyces sp. NPDC050508]|uniref:hypothetical protein n=1 Tax=Streptomyces sp. NPDC050508 TaxID=3155405 RepID=UPI00343ED16E